VNSISGDVELRALYGEIGPLASKKTMRALDRHSRAYIARSPFLVIATTDGDGQMDASPRGDAPGFVLPLDDRTLLLPDRPGNNRLDTYGNIVAHPGVGLLFFIPGIDYTLRVNGEARVTSDVRLLAAAEAQGKVPKAGLIVDIREVFFHCGKALKRSRLWDASTQVVPATFPSLGRIVAEQTAACSVEDADRVVEEDYRSNLY